MTDNKFEAEGDVLEEFLEQLSFVLEEYVLADPTSLTKDALEFRTKVIECLSKYNGNNNTTTNSFHWVVDGMWHLYLDEEDRRYGYVQQLSEYSYGDQSLIAVCNVTDASSIVTSLTEGKQFVEDEFHKFAETKAGKRFIKQFNK